MQDRDSEGCQPVAQIKCAFATIYLKKNNGGLRFLFIDEEGKKDYVYKDVPEKTTIKIEIHQKVGTCICLQ